MLHVVDNLLPVDRLEALRQLCVVHGELKQTHPGDALFSWRADDGSSRSIHALEQRQLMERYLDEHLLPVSTRSVARGLEWSDGATSTTISTGTSTRMKSKDVAAGVICYRCCPRSSIPTSAAPVASCCWPTTPPSPQGTAVRCLSSAP